MASKLTLYRGRTYDFAYAHTDTAGDAVPLTGCTVYFTVKADKYDSDISDTSAPIKKTVTSHTDAAAGLTAWTIDDTDTYIEPGKYYFDVIVEDAGGHAEPPSLNGEVNVIGTPTNRNIGNE